MVKDGEVSGYAEFSSGVVCVCGGGGLYRTRWNNLVRSLLNAILLHWFDAKLGHAMAFIAGNISNKFPHPMLFLMLSCACFGA